ncbi:hypothetical protein DFO80_11478 [Rhodobacter sp. 140A]|uniref:DUF2155 domain-containing protein n=2 Tax=root TaxID=1 RepID=A0A3S3PEK4_9RHOB|nr:DUF2155 domain-containing protein [Sinirhodobacter huangdaonensis]RBP87714.1 hypothetical protein DFO80_11478 [Rhodobacter sp. 140A]RWR52110.1 DUF2155 domain-containing protein [Sinirhodobacter huangdaonensis]
MIAALRAAALALAVGATAAVAQDGGDGLAEASGAVLRGLDKVSATASDIVLAVGQTVEFGHLQVTLKECRYPADDPSSNAYAYLIITDPNVAQPVFEGWMIADSPALSALDHQRYDVWVMRCKTD